MTRERCRGTAERDDAHFPSLSAAHEKRVVFEAGVIDGESSQLAVADAGDDQKLEDGAIAQADRRSIFDCVDCPLRFVVSQNRKIGNAIAGALRRERNIDRYVAIDETFFAHQTEERFDRSEAELARCRGDLPSA